NADRAGAEFVAGIGDADALERSGRAADNVVEDRRIVDGGNGIVDLHGNASGGVHANREAVQYDVVADNVDADIGGEIQGRFARVGESAADIVAAGPRLCAQQRDAVDVDGPLRRARVRARGEAD